MRYIHPPGPKEVPIAAGAYMHYEDDQPTGNTEKWEISRVKDIEIIRFEDDYGDGTRIQAHRRHNQIVRYEIDATGGDDDGMVQSAQATCLTVGRRYRATITRDDETEKHDFVLPPRFVIAPEGLIFGGMKTAALARFAGAQVAVVSYFPTLIAGNALQPVTYQQSVRLIGDTQEQAFGAEQRIRQYELHSATSRDVPLVWINDDGVLLRYAGGDGRHTAVLTHYERFL